MTPVHSTKKIHTKRLSTTIDVPPRGCSSSVPILPTSRVQNSPIPGSHGLVVSTGLLVAYKNPRGTKHIPVSGSNDWPIETALPFGTPYTVCKLSENSRWMQIDALGGYAPGLWVESHHYNELPADQFRLTQKRDISPVLTKNIQALHALHDELCGQFQLPFGSRLPFFDHELKTCLGPGGRVLRLPDAVVKHVASHASKNHVTKIHRADFMKICDQALGAPYVWGVDDCSSLTQRIYRCLGIDLPRNAREQALCGYEVTSHELGDLLFYKNTSTGRIVHVGIFLGYSVKYKRAILLHAKQSVRKETLHGGTLLPESLSQPEENKEFACARRLIG